MDNNMYEQEIDLKDLIFAVFRMWRPIVLIAFIFAVLLGGYKCVKELINLNNEEYVSEIKEQYENDMEKYEQTNRGYERDIENFTASITYQEKYKENSILLKTDPYNKGTSSVDVFVKMSELPKENGITVTSVDYADGVVKAYASAIQQGGALADLSEQKRIDLIYLKELIKVTTDYDSNMLNVRVTYTDEEGAKEILDEIVDSIKSMHPEIQENMGQHSIAIMNQDIGVVTDQTLADYQKQKVDDLAETNQNLEETEKALKELETPEKPVALSKMSILKAGIKYGILGCILGAFLAGFGACVVFFMDGKLSAVNDLKNRFGLKLLGSFTETRKKRAFSGIDDWLDRLEGKENIPDESVYDMAAANIRNFTDKDCSVFLTGTVEEEELKNLGMRLQERLPELKLGLGTDMTRNASTMQEISNYDGIVLIEARGSSKYNDIQKEVETAANMKKLIIGCIVL